jgi:hypothetical protein
LQLLLLTKDTRRVASPFELCLGVNARSLSIVLEDLIPARLSTVLEGEVEVSHETLIRRWPTLKKWLGAASH